LGKDRTIPTVKEGDVIVIKNAGAYGYSMASNYNSRFRPAEVLIYNGEVQLIRQRETMEDILKNQIVLDI
jgi:diaminopimelate decarboxylase